MIFARLVEGKCLEIWEKCVNFVLKEIVNIAVKRG